MNAEDIFRNAKPPFASSKEENWEILQQKIAEDTPVRSYQKPQNLWLWAAAASVLVICLSLWAANQYHESYYVPLAQQDTLYLPDSSQVILRAGSRIAYQPIWWYVSREVQFEGEAFFRVKRGSQFELRSQAGITQVLGTRFQVNTFDGHYEVYCQEGRVGVRETEASELVEITFGERLSLEAGQVVKSQSSDSESLAWLQQKFYFDHRPIRDVLAEMERSYDIKIQYEFTIEADLLLTAAFNKPEDPKSALVIICQVFGLELTQSGPSRFTLTAKAS
ncbi:MAG: FecR domain-containing protein [Bacteroidota bacterium]